MKNIELSGAELDALAQVRRGLFDGLIHTPSILQRLIQLGWVERSPLLVLPVMPSRYRYRLSAAGQQVLARWRRE